MAFLLSWSAEIVAPGQGIARVLGALALEAFDVLVLGRLGFLPLCAVGAMPLRTLDALELWLARAFATVNGLMLVVHTGRRVEELAG